MATDDVPNYVIPPVYTCGNVELLKNRLLEIGSTWTGPTYPVHLKARQKIQQQTYNKNCVRLVELCKFQVKKSIPQPLPNGLTNRKVIGILLDAQLDLVKKPRYRRKLREILESPICEEILQNAFWYFFIITWQVELKETFGQLLFERTSESFAKLVMEQTDKDLSAIGSSSFSASQDDFFVRYSQFLAQMLYASFCYAFPQSQEKFRAPFREQLLQTCSQWICGITVRPNLHDKWTLNKLEPPGFRVSKQRLDDDDEESGGRPKRKRLTIKSLEKKKTVIQEPKRSQTSILLQRRYTQSAGRRKTAANLDGKPDKFGGAFGTAILKALVRRQEKETPREYGFKKNKFNTSGLSKLLHQFFIDEENEKDDRTRQNLPMVNRTEIDPDYPPGVPLSEIVSKSKRKVTNLRTHLERELQTQNRIFHQRELERVKRAAEMDAKIQKLMSSKARIHKFANICLRDATARNPVPTSTILRILNSNNSPLE